MFDTGLNNELLTLDTGFENSAMAAGASTAPQGNPYHQYKIGEDGNWYRGNERVYYWVPPAETDSTIRGGSETQGIGQDLGGYYTEAEIKAAYDADSVLSEQTGGWDNYWGFVSERQAEIQAGNLVDPIQADFAGQAATYAAENTDADAEIANTGRDEEIYYAQSDANEQTAFFDQMAGWVDQNAALMNKYGIAGAYQNGDGDVYAFNGSTYSRTYKAEGVDWGQVFAGVMISAFTGAVGASLGTWFEGIRASLNLPGYVDMAAKGITGATGGFAGAAGGAGANYPATSGAFNPNVIVNLADAGGSNSGGPDMTPPKEDTNDDGTRTYGSYNLPPGYIYNDARGVVINEETGEEYPVEYTLYGSEGSPYNWIVDLPVDGVGGGATDGAPASDPSAPASGGDAEGKYVVVGRNGDGTVTVRDTVDGDIWILEGDYQVGDVVPESEMTDASGANPDMTNGPTDLDKEADDGSLPTLIPPFPETETPDSTPAEPPPDEVVVDPTTDTSTDPDSASTSSVGGLCAMPRPDQYGFTQISWDKYCGGQSEDGTEGANDGSDASGNQGQNGTNSGGDGPGENGDGGSDNNGEEPSNDNQWIDSKGGVSKATWSPLFPGTQFRPRRDFTKGMLASRTPQINFTLDDYTKQRMGLLSSAFKDLA